MLFDCRLVGYAQVRYSENDYASIGSKRRRGDFSTATAKCFRGQAEEATVGGNDTYLVQRNFGLRGRINRFAIDRINRQARTGLTQFD